MDNRRVASELVKLAKELIGAREEIVFKQGGNWIWSHDDGEQEQLPYYVRSKNDVKEFIQHRYDDKRINKSFKISWD